VQLVSASSPSHQVMGSKPSLCRISAGVRLYFGYSLPQTPLVWEPLALGLPFLSGNRNLASLRVKLNCVQVTEFDGNISLDMVKNDRC
jgi:hypothetical protein